MTQIDGSVYMTVNQTAALLGVTAADVVSLLERNEIESLTLIHRDSVRAYLADHTPAGVR